MNITLILYIFITLFWLALAGFLVVRVPQCKNVPLAPRMFVVVFLIFQIVGHIFNLYEILTKENVITVTNNRKNVNAHKNTIDNVSNLLVVSFWFHMFMFAITIFIYYILFKTIFSCKDNVISKNLFWTFLGTSALQIALASVAKTNTDYKLMMNAVSN